MKHIFALVSAALFVHLLAPAPAAADTIPWEIRNHPNPCLEHKKTCEDQEEIGLYDARICEVLSENCKLHAAGKYKPEKVKKVSTPVRMDGEPSACWKFRQDECRECDFGCGECEDLLQSCKEQLFTQWERRSEKAVTTKTEKAVHKDSDKSTKKPTKKTKKNSSTKRKEKTVKRPR